MALRRVENLDAVIVLVHNEDLAGCAVNSHIFGIVELSVVILVLILALPLHTAMIKTNQ